MPSDGRYIARVPPCARSRRSIALALALACLTALAAMTAAATALPRDATLSTAGLGPIRIGMTEAEVEQAGGRAITRQESGGGSECTTATLGKNLFGLFDGPRLARIYVNSRLYATRKGIRVGDSERRVLAVYGRNLTRSRHTYVTGGSYLKLTVGNRRIVFDTDGRRVTQISSGRKPEIDYVEGCA